MSPRDEAGAVPGALTGPRPGDGSDHIPRWALLGVPALAALALYAPLVPGLVADWSAFPSLSHGFAVPVIAAYLVAARWEQIQAAPMASSPWGLPVLILGLAVLFIGVRGDESFVARLSLPIMLLGLCLFLAGPAITRYVWMGTAYLFLMVPLPWTTLQGLTYRSRVFDARASAWALSWLGVPVHRDGVMLYLPNITLEVADACSSIPAIAALLALGAAYASLARRAPAARVAIVAATAPIAIASNIIRITVTAAGTYYSGPWVLKSVYHQLAGTSNFLLTFLLLLALDSLLARVVKGWAR